MNQNWFTAVRLQNNNAIQRLINQGVDINAKDEDGETALYRAVKVGEGAVAKLLEHGADPNIKSDFSEETPLTQAVTLGSVPIVELLLNDGADPNAQNGDEYTSLIIATENISNPDKRQDYERIIELLLNRGADTNLTDSSGLISPLERLIYNYNQAETQQERSSLVPLMRNLIQHGANINALIKDIDEINENEDTLYTPLMLAIKRGQSTSALLMIELGADVNYENINRDTALFIAARKGYYNVVVRLLDAGAKITDIIREIIDENSNDIRSRRIVQLLQDRIEAEETNEEEVAPAEPAYVPNQPRNIANNVNVGTCYDLLEIEDIDARNYLKQDRNNILLVEFNTVLCQNRTSLPKSFAYECREATGFPRADNVIRARKYIKIGLHNNLVSEDDYRKLLDKQYDVYVIKEVEPAKVLKALATVEVVNRQGTWISAYHCQEGSGGKLYKVDAYTLQEGLQYLKREGGKKKAHKLIKKLLKRWHTRKALKKSFYSKKTRGKGLRGKTSKTNKRK